MKLMERKYVIFDGITDFREALAIVLRLLWQIQQQLCLWIRA